MKEVHEKANMKETKEEIVKKKIFFLLCDYRQSCETNFHLFTEFSHSSKEHFSMNLLLFVYLFVVLLFVERKIVGFQM